MPRSPANMAWFSTLKDQSEQRWQSASIDPTLYGFQFQRGTRWLPGLHEPEIRSFETALGVSFPSIYRDFLRCMNGTDLPRVNIYGSSDVPAAYSVGYYSFPRDLRLVHAMIQGVYEAFAIDERFVRAHHIPHIVPLVSHRFLVTDPCPSNPVLSMHGTDVIVYADDLVTFLANDLLHHHTFDHGLIGTPVVVPYWVSTDERGA